MRWTHMLVLVMVAGAAWGQGRHPDEEAALILYESGRDAFKNGDDETAIRDLERALSLVPNDFIRFYLGMAYERSGKCTNAKPLLQMLAGRLPTEQEAARFAALVRCGLAEAESLLQAGDCPGVAAALAGMKGRLPPDLEARRRAMVGACEVRKAQELADQGKCPDAMTWLEKVPKEVAPETEGARRRILGECQRRVAGFVPRDSASRAAFVLLKAGRQALESGNASLAVDKLEKALSLYDEPHIRLLAARARYALLDCPGALAHGERAISDLPEAREEVDSMRAWCATFHIPEGVPEGAPLDKDARRALMERYREATSLRASGIEALAATLSTYDNPAVRIYLGRRLHAAGRHDEAVQMLESVPANRLDPEAAELLQRARFAAMDQNPGKVKDEAYEKWRKAAMRLEKGDAAGAVELASPYPRNPFVARVLAEAYARMGECDRMMPHLSWANRLPSLPQGWADSVVADCRMASERLARERELSEQGRVAVFLKKKARVQRGFGYGLLGVSAACIAVAAVAGWQYHKAVSDSESAMSSYRKATSAAAATAARSAASDAREGARRWSTVGWTVGAVGAAAATTGVLLWVLSERQSLSIGPNPQGGVALVGVF